MPVFPCFLSFCNYAYMTMTTMTNNSSNTNTPTLLASSPRTYDVYIRHIYNQKLISFEKQAARTAMQGPANNGVLSSSSTTKKELRLERQIVAKLVDTGQEMHGLQLHEPSGKSLAPLIVGHKYATLSSMDQRRRSFTGSRRDFSSLMASGRARHTATFGISQTIRCAKPNEAQTDLRKSSHPVGLDGKKDIYKEFPSRCQ